MLKFGEINEVDRGRQKYRVWFPQDGIKSFWLPVATPATKTAQVFVPLAEGEQVACLMDDRCEEGVILGANYNATSDIPDNLTDKDFTLSFPDGSEVAWRDGSASVIDAAGAQVTITDGEISIIDAAGAQVVVSGGRVTVSNDVDNLRSVLADLISQIKLITVLSAAPGSPTGTPLNFAAFDAITARLNQILD